MKKNKNNFKLLSISIVSLISILTPTIALTSCTTKKDNNFTIDKPNTNQSINNKSITRVQLAKIKEKLDFYFAKINNDITDYDSFSSKNIDWIHDFQIELNQIFAQNKIYVPEKNFLSLWGGPENIKYNNQGYQTFPIAIWLWTDSKKAPIYPTNNPEKIKIETKQKNENYNYYLVCDVTTNYKKETTVEKPNKNEFTNIQINQIITILNKYFQTINVDIFAEKINSIFSQQQKQELRNELENILINSGIQLSSDDDFLIMWDGNKSKSYNQQDYLQFLVGIKLNINNVPKYDATQGLSIKKLNNNYYAICNVLTGYQKRINLNANIIEQLQNALATNLNWKIETQQQYHDSQKIITQQINQIVQQFDLQVQSIDYEIISQSPITLNTTITFNRNFYLISNDNIYFEQLNSNTIKSKTTFVTNYFEFVNNINQYWQQIQTPEWTNYNSNQLRNNKPYIRLNIAEPNNEVFNVLFEGFNTNALKTDVLIWLKKIVDNSDWQLKFNLQNLKINYTNNQCQISLSLDVYNSGSNNAQLKILVPNNQNQIIILKSHEKTNINLNIQDKFVKAFDYDHNKVNTNVNTAYYFDNVNLKISNRSTLTYKNFYFNDYSYGLKKRILNFDNHQGYFDIANQGEQYLSNLNYQIMKNDIIDKFNNFNSNFSNLLFSFQNILNSLTSKNYVTNKQFFIKNAVNFKTLIESYACLYKPEFFGLGKIVELCTNGSTLAQVLNNNATKSFLSNYFKDNPNIQKIINLIYHVLINDGSFNDSYNLLINYLCGETIFPSILPNNFIKFFKSIKNILLKLKTTPLIDIIILNFSDLIYYANQYFFNNSLAGEALYYFALAISYRGLNGYFIDSLLAMFKDKKRFSNNKYMSLIEGLLTGLGNNDPNLLLALNEIIVENSSFNRDNLQKLIQIFSCWNEKRNVNSAYNYKTYFDNYIDKKINVEGIYNPNSKIANITIKMSYILKKDIYFNFKDGLNPLLKNVNDLIKKIWGFLPYALCFYANSCFNKTIQLHGKIDYAIVKNQNNQYKITWQALDATTTYDFNSKKTIEDFYDRSNLLIKGFIVFAMRTFTYAYQYTKNRYVANFVENKNNNHFIIENYSPNVPQGDCVFVNNTNTNYIQKLGSDFLYNLNAKRAQESFKISIHKIHKMIVENNFNYYPSLNYLFDLNNLVTDNKKNYLYTSDSQTFVDQEFATTNIRIRKGKIQLRFKSPVYFYDKNAKKYVVKDNWTFNFFKLWI